MAEKAHWGWGMGWGGVGWGGEQEIYKNIWSEFHLNPFCIEKMGPPPSSNRPIYQPKHPPLLEFNLQRHIFSTFEQPFKTHRRLRHSNALARPKVISSRVTPWQLNSPVSATRYLRNIPVVILGYNPRLAEAPSKRSSCQDLDTVHVCRGKEKVGPQWREHLFKYWWEAAVAGGSVPNLSLVFASSGCQGN